MNCTVLLVFVFLLFSPALLFTFCLLLYHILFPAIFWSAARSNAQLLWWLMPAKSFRNLFRSDVTRKFRHGRAKGNADTNILIVLNKWVFAFIVLKFFGNVMVLLLVKMVDLIPWTFIDLSICFSLLNISTCECMGFPGGDFPVQK